MLLEQVETLGDITVEWMYFAYERDMNLGAQHQNIIDNGCVPHQIHKLKLIPQGDVIQTRDLWVIRPGE